jgi:putative tryptophan/tyrosine transport system substrate-binding protein
VKRRAFITLLGGAAAAWPLAARAQQPALPVVGWVNAGSAAEWAERTAAFHRGLGETGFVQGRNVAIEFRWADGHLDRMPAMAADLVGRQVAVIVVGGNIVGVRAVMTATQTIPIVFTTGTDPVAAGVVDSLNRPGRNSTGFTLLSTELAPKRLELLHEVIPSAAKIALLVNRNNPVTSQADIQSGNAAAHRLGLEIIVLDGGSESEIEHAFATVVQERAAAVLLGSDAFFNVQRQQIAALGLRHAIPTIGEDRQSVASGLLIGYGTNNSEMYRQAGVYVGRILKGEKPADLPVMQPTKFELYINLKTAKTLGLMVPESFLLRADEVIE